MLISRIAATASSSSSSVSGGQGSSPGDRKGSLKHLWYKLQHDIAHVFESKAFTSEFNCQILDVSESGWIPSAVVIRENGNAELHHESSEEPFAIVRLPKSTILGHLGKLLIQISGHTQTFLLKCDQAEFGTICATLLAWSRLRNAGILQKTWCPDIQELDDPESDLLRCEVKAHFTVYNPQYMRWYPFVARLKRNGMVQLSDAQSQNIYSLQIRKVLGSRIYTVDPSVVDPKMVILLFPDLGGPESVYLQFNDIDDFEDWVATLKSMSIQPVAAPLNHDPLMSVRWWRSIEVKVASCRPSDHAEGPIPDLRDTYVDVCLNRWVFARTCLNSEAKAANWDQTFMLPGPETTIYGGIASSQIEFQLKQYKSAHHAVGGDQDTTVGSYVLPQIDDDTTWQWYDLPPSNLSLNISASQLDIPVLDASYYRKLYDWMSDLSLFPTSRLVAAMPTSLSKLFPVFNEMYRAQGRQIEWIMNLASEEVKSLDINSDTIFRESSLFTRAMEFLLQQHGEDTLQRTVGRFVRKLIAGTDESLELDPARNNNPEQIQSNIIAMGHFLNYLWSLIRNEDVPPICKPIFRRMKSELKLLGLADEQIQKVMNRAMSSLLFLRFYVPAILNPQLYGLTNKTVEPPQRRTLVLVAKFLQVFANRVKFGNKQMWLVPMNKFIEEHDPSLVSWYSEICAEKVKSTSMLIRRVENDTDSDFGPERPSKELPVEAFMGQQLTSPNLIDEWATYSRFAKLISEISSDSTRVTNASDDSLVGEVIKECCAIISKQGELIQALESPDNFDESASASPPHLYLNFETLLFGTGPDQLEPEAVQPNRTSSFSSSMTRLSWLPKSTSSNDVTVDEVRPKHTSSVRKLTQMLRIAKPSQGK